MLKETHIQWIYQADELIQEQYQFNFVYFLEFENLVKMFFAH